MILTVNIGNTHITVGGYDHDAPGSAVGCILTRPPPSTNTPSGWSICFRSTAHRQIKSRAAFWAVWCRC